MSTDDTGRGGRMWMDRRQFLRRSAGGLLVLRGVWEIEDAAAAQIKIALGLKPPPIPLLPSPGPTPSLTTVLRRREDQLRLKFDFYNLELNTGGALPKLVRKNNGQPARVVVHFLPQHVMEEAAYEYDADTQTGVTPPPGQDGPEPTASTAPKQPPVAHTSPVGAAWPSWCRTPRCPSATASSVSSSGTGGSRVWCQSSSGTPANSGLINLGPDIVSQVTNGTNDIVDDVTAIVQNPGTLSSRLDSIIARVTGIVTGSLGAAGIGSAGGPGRATPRLQAPDSTHTAIEMPWWLLLSPTLQTGWAHTAGRVTHGEAPSQVTELWHTRLGGKAPGANTVDENDRAADDRTRRVGTRP